MERPSSLFRNGLARLSLDLQEQAALKLSYQQLHSLRGIEEFRDLLSSKKFWIAKILHNFPQIRADELSLYDVHQLQARYCYLAANKAQKQAHESKIEEDSKYRTEKVYAMFMPGAKALESKAKLIRMEMDQQKKQRELLERSQFFFSEAKSLFKFPTDPNLYQIEINLAQFEQLKNLASTKDFAYDLQEYLYRDLIDESADFQIQPEQLLQFQNVEGETLAWAYIYSKNTTYLVDFNFPMPNMGYFQLPGELFSKLTFKEVIEKYDLPKTD